MTWMLVTRSLALECYEGRGFDRDMERNIPGVGYRDEIFVRTCAVEEPCCVRFAASRCCTLESRKYSIADGTCGNTTVCDDATFRDALCGSYGADECNSKVCYGDRCNDLHTFDSSSGAPWTSRPPHPGGVFLVASVFSWWWFVIM